MYENETNIQARDRGYADGEKDQPPSPVHDYTDERASAYIDGHRLGKLVYLQTHASEPQDIFWILSEAVTGHKLKDNCYVIQEKGGDSRQCVLSWTPEGRLTFNGEDIDTEDYMCYVGLTDMIDDGMTDFPKEDL
jgi:hypothetical protein